MTAARAGSKRKGRSEVVTIAMAMHAGSEDRYEPRWRALWIEIPNDVQSHWRSKARAFLRALRKP